MRKLSVAASKNYDILIGNGLLPQLGGYVKALEKIQTVALVSETTVYPLFGQAAEKSLADAGFQVKSFVFSAGEASKCADTYLKLLTFLARNHLTRTDAIVALGGGVVGDLAGFAAATYLRGIRFVQVPTTLLAAVDSSVGGKTAIDLPEGKNLVGAFWQPSLVLCDTACLDTLPKATFRDGCAEVIKYGILFDRDFFDYLSETGMEFDREYVIERCVAMKRDVVDRDESGSHHWPQRGGQQPLHHVSRSKRSHWHSHCGKSSCGKRNPFHGGLWPHSQNPACLWSAGGNE